MRDNQRGAVYSWERALRGARGDRQMTLDECRALVSRVWRSYLGAWAPMPEIKDGRGRRSACGSRWEISLPTWARTPLVVLHETAHALLDFRCASDPWHGALFASLTLELWARYAKVGKGAARAAAVKQRPRRVRFAPKRELDRALCRR